MFKWLFVNKNKDSEATRELAMRARIATKLRNYNAAEDTTISSFSLAGEAAQRKTEVKAPRTGNRDVPIGSHHALLVNRHDAPLGRTRWPPLSMIVISPAW